MPFCLLNKSHHNERVENGLKMKVLAKIELLLVGLWLGSACFFSFVVAPSAFSVLPSAELAGNLVNRTLMIVNISGFVVGILLVASSFLPRSSPGALWVWLRRVLLLVLAAACGVGQFVIALWLTILRGRIGKPIAELALDDPVKLRFDMLHQSSVWVLVAGMIAALAVFFVMTRAGSEKPAEKPVVDPAFDFSKEM